MECISDQPRPLVCDALNNEIGGRVLIKNPENFLQELSHIGQ